MIVTMMMKRFAMRAIATLFYAWFASAPAFAQWQTPNHSIPVGQGAGFTGFRSVGPCGSGTVVAGTGSSSDPTCQTIRLSLTANQSYYVNGNSGSTATCGPAGASTCAAGSDSNDCLTPSTACLTLQHAYAVAVAKDMAQLWTSTIYLAHNTGTTNYNLLCASGTIIGSAVISVVGDSSAPLATVIKDPNAGYGLQVKDLCTLEYDYIRFIDSAGNSAAGHILLGGTGNATHLDAKGIDFGALASGAHMSIGSLSSFAATGNSTISGGAPQSLNVGGGGAQANYASSSFTLANATVTITIATPGVITWTGHGLTAGAPVAFTTTGALPTGLTAGATYYVTSDGSLTTNAFHVSDTLAHALAGTNTVNTSGSQSGTHTGMPAFTTAFAVISSGGDVVGSASTFSGSAGGSRCIISGPGPIGDLQGNNPNKIFPGNSDCVMIGYHGSIGFQTGSGAASSFNFGSLGQPVLSGGGAGAPNTYGTLGYAGGGTNATTLAGALANFGYPVFTVFADNINCNSSGDTAIPISSPTTNVIITGLRISGVTGGSITTATAGLYTAASGGGVLITAGGVRFALSGITTDSDNTTSNAVNQALNPIRLNLSTLATPNTVYFNIGTPQGATCTINAVLQVQPMP